MLVYCDKCGQEYEVDETRLPPQGARIKCPTCSSIFLVRPNRTSQPIVMPAADDAVIAAAAAADPAPTPAPLADTTSEEWKVRHIGLTYSFHDLNALRDWLSARASLDGVKVAKGDDEWKELGDYPDVLTTEMITKFFPLGDVPTSNSKNNAGPSLGPGTLNGSTLNGGPLGTLNGGTLGTLNGSTLGGTLNGMTLNGASSKSVAQTSSDLSQSVQSKNKRQIKIEREKAKKAKEEAKKKVIVIAVVGLILVGCAIFGITYATTGRLPFTSAPAPEEVITETPSAPTVPVVVDSKDEAQRIADEEEEVLKAQQLAEMLRQEEAKLNERLNEARSLIDAKKWPEARATLESMNQERPDHLETLELLVKTYKGLGENALVTETEERIRRVIAAEKSQEAAAEDMVFGEE